MRSFIRSKETSTLLGIVIPFTFAMIVVRLVRLTHSGWSLGILDTLRMDMGFYGGLILFSLGLSLSVKGRRLNIFLTQVLFAFFLATEFIAANFLVATGNWLDYGMMAFTLQNLGDTWEVIQSETPIWLPPTIFIGALFLVIVPWIIWRSAEKRAVPNIRYGLPITAVGILLIGSTFLPAIFSDSIAAVRPPGAHVVATGAQNLVSHRRSHRGLVENFVDGRFLAAKKDRPNIVVLILESTRASATSLHPTGFPTTPFLKEISKKSIVATQAKAVVPHTSKALVAILCGFEPFLEMAIVEAAQGLPGRCLPELLKYVGYQTAFIQTATRKFEDRANLLQKMQFDHFESAEDFDTTGFAKVNYFGVEDEVMLKPIEKWLDNRSERPFLLSVLTVGTHHNYQVSGRHGFEKYSPREEFNRYLNAVHAEDQFVKQVFDILTKKNVLKDTIVVIVGDHGEGFGEHGRSQHDNTIYEEGIHIPLLIYDGRHPEHFQMDLGVSQMDILPTIADLAGYKIFGAKYPGTSIKALKEERMIPSHCWYSRNCMSANLGGKKFIHHFEKKPDEFFDLTTDPLEKKRLGTDSEEAKRLSVAIQEWRQRVLARYQQFYPDCVSADGKSDKCGK